MNNGESICRRTLPTIFKKVHLVNMQHIAEYLQDSITLSNGETIFLAKERYREFIKEYMRYLNWRVYE